MPTYSKSLVIFTLFVVLWLENKAHYSGFPHHKKTQKKFGEGKTSISTSKPTPTTATIIKINHKYKCNTSTVPSCQCGYYYPVPKSGNCKDVFKRLSTIPTDYHFREENCSLVQRPVCSVISSCEDHRTSYQQLEPLPPTPYEFLIGQNTRSSDKKNAVLKNFIISNKLRKTNM